MYFKKEYISSHKIVERSPMDTISDRNSLSMATTLHLNRAKEYAQLCFQMNKAFLGEWAGSCLPRTFAERISRALGDKNNKLKHVTSKMVSAWFVMTFIIKTNVVKLKDTASKHCALLPASGQVHDWLSLLSWHPSTQRTRASLAIHMSLCPGSPSSAV